jgi:hypothetical protein
LKREGVGIEFRGREYRSQWRRKEEQGEKKGMRERIRITKNRAIHDSSKDTKEGREEKGRTEGDRNMGGGKGGGR